MVRAYDTPIVGYNTYNTIALRLWKSHPANEFDFSSFNTGDYFRVREKDGFNIFL
jgi:starch phosphorylase